MYRILFALPVKEILPQLVPVWNNLLRGKGNHLLFDQPDWFVFYDSLAVTVPWTQDIIRMALDTGFTSENRVLWMLVDGMQDGTYAPEALQPFRGQILSEITRWIAEKQQDQQEPVSDEYGEYYEYDEDELYLEEARIVKLINLLGLLNPGPDADALISKLFELEKEGLYRPLMHVWIMHGKADSIPEEYLYHLRTDEDKTIAFWKLLERNGKTGNYPASMLDQREFAKAWAWQYLRDNDTTGTLYMEEVMLPRTIFHQGDSAIVYLCKVQWSGAEGLMENLRGQVAEPEEDDGQQLEGLRRLMESMYSDKYKMMLVGPFKTGEGNVTTDCSLCRIGEEWGDYTDEERLEMLLSPAEGK